jgi:hypothetical protein
MTTPNGITLLSANAESSTIWVQLHLLMNFVCRLRRPATCSAHAAEELFTSQKIFGEQPKSSFRREICSAWAAIQSQGASPCRDFRARSFQPSVCYAIPAPARARSGFLFGPASGSSGAAKDPARYVAETERGQRASAQGASKANAADTLTHDQSWRFRRRTQPSIGS